VAREAARARRVNRSRAAVPSHAARPVAWSGGTPAVTVPIGSPSPAMADRGAVVIVSHSGAAQPATELPGLLASARAQAAAALTRSQELQQWTEHVLAEARTARRTSAQARRQRRSSPAGRDLMQQSEHARLIPMSGASGIPRRPGEPAWLRRGWRCGG